MGGIGSGPSLKMAGFQSGPSLKNEGDFGTKNNKETYIFWKGGSFGAAQVGKLLCIFLKRGSFRAVQVEKVEQTNVYFWKGGLPGRSRLKKWNKQIVGSAQQGCNYHFLQKSLFCIFWCILYLYISCKKLHLGVLKLTTKNQYLSYGCKWNHGYAQRKSVVSWVTTLLH